MKSIVKWGVLSFLLLGPVTSQASYRCPKGYYPLGQKICADSRGTQWVFYRGTWWKRFMDFEGKMLIENTSGGRTWVGLNELADFIDENNYSGCSWCGMNYRHSSLVPSGDWRILQCLNGVVYHVGNFEPPPQTYLEPSRSEVRRESSQSTSYWTADGVEHDSRNPHWSFDYNDWMSHNL